MNNKRIRSVTYPLVLSKRLKSQSEETMITIDGSFGEGGGQILRNAISYAGILKRSVTINNIRKHRSRPGLRAQHVTSINLVRDLVGGELTGNALNSETVTYIPSAGMSTNLAKEIIGDTKTAGSVCLLLQASLPVCLYRNVPSKLILKGGTEAQQAPMFDYFHSIFLPVASSLFRFEVQNIEVIRRGFYPRGGGEVQISIDPIQIPLKAVNLTHRGKLETINISSFHTKASATRKAAKIMMETSNEALKQSLPKSVSFSKSIHDYSSIGNASGILLTAKFSSSLIIGASAIGTPEESPIQTAQSAVAELQTCLLSQHACVDEWLQDQLILYMTLAQGVSKVKVHFLTLHTKTAIHVAKIMCPEVRFMIEKLNDEEKIEMNLNCEEYGKNGMEIGPFLITCHGIGYVNST